MTDIKLPKGCTIKIFRDEQELLESLKPYNCYYWDMSKKIRDLKKYSQESIVKDSKDKQEVFNKIMEQLDEAREGYYEKLSN